MVTDLLTGWAAACPFAGRSWSRPNMSSGLSLRLPALGCEEGPNLAAQSRPVIITAVPRQQRFCLLPRSISRRLIRLGRASYLFFFRGEAGPSTRRRLDRRSTHAGTLPGPSICLGRAAGSVSSLLRAAAGFKSPNPAHTALCALAAVPPVPPVLVMDVHVDLPTPEAEPRRPAARRPHACGDSRTWTSPKRRK